MVFSYVYENVFLKPSFRLRSVASSLNFTTVLFDPDLHLFVLNIFLLYLLEKRLQIFF